MIKQSDIIPIGGRVLLEAIEAETISGPEGEVDFFLPPEHLERYPHSGWVIRGGNSLFERNDIAVLRDEGKDVPRTYYDVFKIVLEDEIDRYELIVDHEVFDPFVETMRAYYREPAKHKHRRISVKDVDSTPWTFECQDVLDFSMVELAHPTYTLEYLPTEMMELWTPEGRKKLHYFVDSRNVLLLLKDW